MSKDEFVPTTIPGYGACQYLIKKQPEKKEGGIVALRNIWEIILGKPAVYKPLTEYSPMLDEIEGDD